MNTSACRLTAAFAAACLVASAVRAQPQIPEGYEVVRLTDDLAIHSVPDINDRGDVVWSSSFPPNESDIFLFADGVIRHIEMDPSYEVYPQINNLGSVTCTAGENYYGPFDVMFYRNGNGSQVYDSVNASGYAPINDAGFIVWTDRFSPNPHPAELFLYDGEITQQFTANGLSNQGARINSAGEIVWTRYNFDMSPWTSTIMLYSHGRVFELSDGAGQPQSPDVNDLGQVVWSCSYGCDPSGIYLWNQGNATTITPAGAVPRINNRGEIAFARWNDIRERWDVWLYAEGEFFQLSGTERLAADPSMNDHGEVAWRTLDPQSLAMDTYLMRKVASKGDFNGDCSIDWIDFGAFQYCHTGADGGPPTGLLSGCMRGDFDLDGDVDHLDFQEFVEAYTGPGVFVPGCGR